MHLGALNVVISVEILDKFVNLGISVVVTKTFYNVLNFLSNA